MGIFFIGSMPPLGMANAWETCLAFSKRFVEVGEEVLCFWETTEKRIYHNSEKQRFLRRSFPSYKGEALLKQRSKGQNVSLKEGEGLGKP